MTPTVPVFFQVRYFISPKEESFFGDTYLSGTEEHLTITSTTERPGYNSQSASNIIQSVYHTKMKHTYQTVYTIIMLDNKSLWSYDSLL